MGNSPKQRLTIESDDEGIHIRREIVKPKNESASTLIKLFVLFAVLAFLAKACSN